MNLRLATNDDVELIAQIRRTAILAQSESFWDRSYLKKVAEFWGDEHFAEALISNKIYIYADYAFVGHKADYLAYLFVLPSQQNKQIGAKLLKFVEDNIHAEGFAQAWLLAHPYAERFYEMHGYVDSGETQAPFGKDLKKLIKQLATDMSEY